jgi:cytochrome c-type biogenesis protein CcmH/NrfF
MSDISAWFWPALYLLLAAIWLWTLMRHRQRAPAARTSVSGLTYRSAEAEDALKAAYAIQEAGGAWAPRDWPAP